MARRVVGLVCLVAVLLLAGGIPFHAGARAATDPDAWAWGYNGYGQLGDGSTTDRPSPVPVGSPVQLVALAGGARHGLGLAADGSVWAWGSNEYAQLGDGTTVSRTTPARVAGLSDATAVSAGAYLSLALRRDGTVWAWGPNWEYQLGTAAVEQSAVPLQVAGLSGVTAIAAGARGGAALRVDGTVWTWGANAAGQLGDGTTAARPEPRPVQGLGPVRALASGVVAGHYLAILTDGTVRAWGSNQVGQLGSATSETCTGSPCSTRPVRVPGLTDAVAVAGGLAHSLAVRADGSVWAWGHNGFGELGVGPKSADPVPPTRVPGLEGMRAVSGGYATSLALRADGAVFGWGRNEYGQAGVADRRWTVDAPTRVAGLPPVGAVYAASYFSLATTGAPPPPPSVRPSRALLPVVHRSATQSAP